MSYLDRILLDADGVLLNYNQAYALAWESAFGERLSVQRPNAYWAKDIYAARTLTPPEKEQLRFAMDVTYWSTMPALPGALEACLRLKAAGFSLICVTALSPEFGQARADNLAALGFPLEAVVAVGRTSPEGQSPKAAAVKSLCAQYFADDFAPYFMGLSAQDTHRALINRAVEDSPNVGEFLALADSVHGNLGSFADWVHQR